MSNNNFVLRTLISITPLLGFLVSVSTLIFVVMDSGYRKESDTTLRAMIQDNESSEIKKWVNLEAMLEEMSVQHVSSEQRIGREIQNISIQQSKQEQIINQGLTSLSLTVNSTLQGLEGLSTETTNIRDGGPQSIAGINNRLDTIENTEAIRQREIIRLASQFATLADEEYAKGHYLVAAKDYQRAWEMDPNSTVYPLGYALSLNSAGLPNQSGKIRSALETVMLRDPYNEKALGLYYRMAIDNNDAESALIYGMKLSRLRPKDPELSYWLGHMLKSRGRYQESVPFLKIAYEGLANNTGVVYALGESLTALRRYDEAKDILNASLQSENLAVPARQSLGQIYFETGQYSLAIAEWESILSVRPDSETYGKIGKTWNILGNNAKAINYWEDAIASVSIHSRADRAEVAGYYESITRTLIKNEKWNKAKKYCNMGLAVLSTPELRDLLELARKRKKQR